jgi:hypothetical protein
VFARLALGSFKPSAPFLFTLPEPLELVEQPLADVFNILLLVLGSTSIT